MSDQLPPLSLLLVVIVCSAGGAPQRRSARREPTPGRRWAPLARLATGTGARQLAPLPWTRAPSTRTARAATTKARYGVCFAAVIEPHDPSLIPCDCCFRRVQCGWCSATQKCSTGTSTGPTTGTCPAGDWDWGTSTCTAPTDTCNQYSNCVSCNDVGACGWCSSNNVCSTGTSSGPTTAACPSGDWDWGTSTVRQGCLVALAP